MTKLSDNTNKKPQITTTDNKEKEIYKEKEDPVVSIFEFWNSKNLPKCPELVQSLRNIILSTLKSFTLEQIKLYISRYDEIYNRRDYYFSHSWSLNRSYVRQMQC